MLKTRHESDRQADPRCVETREIPAAFLRLQSSREQVALPYSSLIKLSLKTDGTALELSYVTHRVTIIGKNLAEIYKAVADLEARLITVAAEDFADAARLPSYTALVREIRIEPLDAEERHKQ